MPHISLSLYQGRSREELEKLSHSLQTCLVETAGWKPGDISVSVEGILPEEFAQQVGKKIKSEEIIITSELIR